MSTAIFSFLGIIIGASLQYIFTRHLDSQKHHRELRTKAYTDYLRCACELANIEKSLQSPEGRDLCSRTADAKTRICLYGSNSAVEKFADFERCGAVIKTSEQRAVFTKMVAIMRSDSSSGRQVEHQDLGVVLLGGVQRDVA